MERALFQTPYHYGALGVETGPPACFCWQEAAQTLVDARIGGTATPAPTEDQWWEGSVALPRSRRSALLARYFNARLGGPTEVFPFTTPRDSFMLRPASTAGIVRRLADSGFRPTEWRVRRSATHARSRTYSRSGSD